MPARLAASPELIHAVARCLLEAPPSTAPAEALGLIGAAFDADRAWLIRLDETLQNFWVSHEWCAEGVPACLPDFPGVPTALIAHPMRDFVRDRVVVIADIEKLPPDAQALKEEMRREGNRATAGAPLFRAGRLTALIGLDDTRKVHRWTPNQLLALRDLGELLVAAADRSPAGQTRDDAAKAGQPKSGGCYLRAGNCHVQVRWEEILAISAEGDHTRVRLTSGRELFELKALTVWETMLPPEHFLRVHRSWILNWSEMHRVRRGSGGRWVAELHGCDINFPIGRSYQAAVRQRLNLGKVKAKRPPQT